MTDAPRESYPDNQSALREALDNSQSLLVMIYHIGDGSISALDWANEDLSKLIADQISENRTALTAPQTASVAQTGKLPGMGDLVRLQEASPYYHDWRGIVMKIVSLRIDPDDKLWASVIDTADPRNTPHRGFGIYDGETDGFELDHLEMASPLPSTNRGASDE